MLKEFMKSKVQKDLVIITNVEENKFYQELKEITKFQEDSRIKFVGTVYDDKMLQKIRENAYGYIHGHEVGGTNPSLLEALAMTDLNLLLDVGFNEEVGQNGALYWEKQENNLSNLINRLEKIPREDIEEYSNRAKKRIQDEYNWEKIVTKYERKYLGEKVKWKYIMDMKDFQEITH